MSLMEEIDCGNFFDQIDDLLEVPNDVEKGLVDNRVTGEYNDFPPVFWSGNSPVFSAVLITVPRTSLLNSLFL